MIILMYWKTVVWYFTDSAMLSVIQKYSNTSSYQLCLMIKYLQVKKLIVPKNDVKCTYIQNKDIYTQPIK